MACYMEVCVKVVCHPWHVTRRCVSRLYATHGMLHGGVCQGCMPPVACYMEVCVKVVCHPWHVTRRCVSRLYATHGMLHEGVCQGCMPPMACYTEVCVKVVWSSPYYLITVQMKTCLLWETQYPYIKHSVECVDKVLWQVLPRIMSRQTGHVIRYRHRMTSYQHVGFYPSVLISPRQTVNIAHIPALKDKPLWLASSGHEGVIYNMYKERQRSQDLPPIH